jgi:hypothetical protein
MVKNGYYIRELIYERLVLIKSALLKLEEFDYKIFVCEGLIFSLMHLHYLFK